MKKLISFVTGGFMFVSLLSCPVVRAETDNIIKEIYVYDDILVTDQTINEGIPEQYYYPSNYFTTYNISTTGFDKEYVNSVTLFRFIPSGNGQKAGQKMQIYNVTPEMNNLADISYSSISEAGGFSKDNIVYEETFAENQETSCYDEFDITEYMTSNEFDDYLTIRTDFLKPSGDSYIRSWALVYPNEQANMKQRAKIAIEYNVQAIIDAMNSASNTELEYLIKKYGDLFGIDVKTYDAIENKDSINNLLASKSFTTGEQIRAAVEQELSAAYPAIILNNVSDNADNEKTSFAAALNLKQNTYTVNLNNVNFNQKNVKSVRAKIYITNDYNNPANNIYALDENYNVIGGGYFDGTKNKYYSIDITDYAKSCSEELNIKFSGPSASLTFQTSKGTNPPQIEIYLDENALINDLNTAGTADKFEKLFGDYGTLIGFDYEYVTRYKHKIAESFYLRQFDSIESLKQAVKDYSNVLAQDALDRMNNALTITEFRTVFESEYDMLGIDLSVYNTLDENNKTYYANTIYKQYSNVDEFKEAFNNLFSTAFVLNTTVTTSAQMEEFINNNAEEHNLKIYNQIEYKDSFNNILLANIPYKSIEEFSALFDSEIEKRLSTEFMIIPEAESGYSKTDLVDFTKWSDKIYKFDLSSKYFDSDYLVSADLVLTRSAGDGARSGDLVIYSVDNSWTDATENLDTVLSDTSITAGKISNCTVPAGRAVITVDILDYLKHNSENTISLRTAGNLQGYYNVTSSVGRTAKGAKILIKADIAGIIDAINHADKNTIKDIIINNGHWLGINVNAYINSVNKAEINGYLLSDKYQDANQFKQRFDEIFNSMTYSSVLPCVSDGGSAYNANLGSLAQALSAFYYNEFNIDSLRNDFILSVKVGYTKAQQNNEYSNTYIYGGTVADGVFSPNTDILNEFIIGDELNTYYETDITDYVKSQSGNFAVGIIGDKFAYINRIKNAPYIKVSYDLLKIANAIGSCNDKESAMVMLNTYSKELSLYSEKQIETLSEIITGMTFDNYNDFLVLVKLCDENKTGISKMTDSNVVLANGASQEVTDIVVAVALFDENNLMTSVLSVNTIDSIPGGETVSIPYNISQTGSNLQVKALVWKGSQSLIPIDIASISITPRD